MDKAMMVDTILKGRSRTPVALMGSAFAPSNIALCKYWGKRNIEINLPQTSSLSISLGHLGTSTTVSTDCSVDTLIVNGQLKQVQGDFYRRVFRFIDLFRTNTQPLLVDTEANIPINAGLASSASGFAALTQSLNQLFDWQLSKKELSLLARLGSGSATRSFWSGFVEWHKGELDSGMDSFAAPIETHWKDLRVGIVICDHEEKTVSSREAMQRSIDTSPYYESWPKIHAVDFLAIKTALLEEDFDRLGLVSERNALAMHALMTTSTPPVMYTLPETVLIMKSVWQARKDGLQVFFTQDAGPNLKLLYLANDQSDVLSLVPSMQSINPFDGTLC